MNNIRLVSDRVMQLVEKIKKHENKEIPAGYTVIAVAGIYSFSNLIRTVISVIAQRNSYINMSAASVLAAALFQLATFVALTHYDYWNYHKRKLLFVGVMAFTLVTAASGIFTYLYGITLRPLVFMLPVTEDISPAMIINTSRLLDTVFTALPSAALAYRVFSLLGDGEVRKGIYGFKIDKIIDMRKDKRFKYDLKFLRRMDTGLPYVIKMKDRQLHASIGGATGAAKTSTVLTISIANDLDQKAFNEDYCKKELEKRMDSDIAKNRMFHDRDFKMKYFTGLTKEGEHFIDGLMAKAPSAGITCLAPNESFSDEIYMLATNRGFKVNRVDPILTENDEHKEGFIGFNPLYIPERLTGIKRELDIFKKAKLFADVLQALYDMSGSSDVYFAKLNKNVTTAFTILLLVTMEYVHPGHHVTPEDVQRLVDDFDLVKPYYYALLKNYGDNDDVFDAAGNPIPARLRDINCGRYQFIVPLVNNDILSENGRKQMENQIRGLRTIMSDFINNPLIHDVFCVQESIDIDKILEDGEITVVNYALELGMCEATAFGLFFSLSFNNAVVRRPGTEFTRLPHYYYIDEFPILLHSDQEQMFTMFRQYNVSNMVAFQTYDLFDKTPVTRFLKGVVMNNTAHQVVFGRVSVNEMDMFSKLAGKELQTISQDTVSETPISDPDTKKSFSSRITPTWVNAREGADFRYKDFREVSVFTVDQGSPKTVFDCKVSFLDKKRRNSVTSRYAVDWDKYETVSMVDEAGDAEKTVTENPVKLSGTDKTSGTGQGGTADGREDGRDAGMDTSFGDGMEKISGQVMEDGTVPDRVNPRNAIHTAEPGDLTDLFSVNETGEDPDENEELLQKYYEKLMKEEEQNRQFEAYGQDGEQQPCNSSLLDSDADTGCFDMSIDGFGMTDD